MKLVLAFSFILITLQLQSQILIPKKDYVPEVRKSRYSFGISLLPSGNSLVTYGIHRMAPDSTVEMTFLSFESFVRQLSGFEQSKANPDKINFMEEYNITPENIQSLWKLRYAEYPLGKSKETGWGGKLGMPSSAQMQLLANFGVQRIGDVIYGENLRKLLIKMNDPLWVGQYQQLK